MNNLVPNVYIGNDKDSFQIPGPQPLTFLFTYVLQKCRGDERPSDHMFTVNAVWRCDFQNL